MNSDLHLKWDIKLQSFAAISAIISFWEMPHVQKKIQNHFVNDYNWSQDNRSEWKKITFVVRDHIKSLAACLSENIVRELELLASVIQEKIYSWYRYVMVELKLHPKYASKIYWDSQARIDQGKIFERFWRNDPEFYRARNYKPLGMGLMCPTLVIAFEEFTQKNSGKAVDDIDEAVALLSEIFNISLIRLHFSENLPGYVIDSAVLVKWGLRKVADRNFNRAYKVLASKFILNISNKLGSLAQNSLKKVCDPKVTRCIKDNQIDIFLHTFKQMSLSEQLSFFFENVKLLANAFMQVWPYQTIFLQILSFIGGVNFSELEDVHPQLLKEVIKISNKRDSNVPEIYKNVDDVVIIRILQMMGKDAKRETILNYNILTSLFSSHSYRVLYYIINDPDLAYEKDEISGKSDQAFLQYVREYMSDELRRCSNGQNLTDKEKKRLEFKLNLVKSLIHV